MVLSMFLLLLVLSAAISFGITLYALRRRETQGARSFALLLAGSSLYAIGYIFELLAPTLTTKILWDNIEFTATDIIAIGSLLFALNYSGRSGFARRLTPWLLLLLITNALVLWSDHLHHLVRPNAWVIDLGDISVLAYSYGPWFWYCVFYSYTMILVTLGILFVSFLQIPRFYRLQIVAIILAIIVPPLSSILTVSGLVPLPHLHHLDITPLLSIISYPIWAWGLFSQRLLGLVPIARNRLVEHMPDASSCSIYSNALWISTQAHTRSCAARAPS